MTYSNVYYSPERFGLEPVGEIEWDNESYQFNLTAVWRHKETGVFYYADDSGCSCPAPFEDLEIDDLTEIGRAQELIDHLEARRASHTGYWYGNVDEERNRLAADVGELIQRVRAL